MVNEMTLLDLSLFKTDNVSVELNDDGRLYTFGLGGGRIEYDGFKAYSGKYIVADLTNRLDISTGITWSFSASDGRFIAFKMGLLPGLKTRIALPFSVLDGSTLFLPRTPGKLKTVTQGRPIPIDAVSSFKLSAGDSRCEMKLTIHGLYISDSEPEYPLPDVKMVDALGQKLCTDWPGKTKSTDELREYMRTEFERTSALDGQPSLFGDDRSRFGGWKKKPLGDATGFFRLTNDGRRYWLVDPDGYAFFSMGLDCVTVDGDCNLNGITKLCCELPPRGSVGWNEGRGDTFSFHKSNLYKAFGGDWYDNWSLMTRVRMNEWGFNTIACWSDLDHARRSGQPYTYIFGGRPLTKARVFRDFPDVFSPEYREVSREWAAQIKPFADDPYLLGYFMGNEPEWAFVNELNLAELLWDKRGFASRDRLIGFLTEKYGDVVSLNRAWETSYKSFDDISTVEKPNRNRSDDTWAFTREMIREYMRVMSEEIHGVDKNHLNLGIRYAWLSSEALASGSEYVDIFSFNCYQIDPTDSINNFYAKVKKPVIIGEFHFGALDVGLDATGLRGVTSQHERGVAYRYYMQKAASSPYCLGAHYFTLNDQAYLGRFDGENYQIGVVDVCQKPYAGFVEGIIKTHAELYEIADGKAPDARRPQEIPAIAF